jgi:hypothetical protein
VFQAARYANLPVLGAGLRGPRSAESFPASRARRVDLFSHNPSHRMFPRPGRKAAESAERSPAPDARPDGELEGSARAHRAARERSRSLLRPA